MAKRIVRPTTPAQNWSPDDFIEIPTGPGMRNEPVIRGKYVPVWVLWAYATHHGMTPEQISKLWLGEISEQEVTAALQYAEAHPDLIEDKTKG
jgi:uncharacterized protein (DUF433 family)